MRSAYSQTPTQDMKQQQPYLPSVWRLFLRHCTCTKLTRDQGTELTYACTYMYVAVILRQH